MTVRKELHEANRASWNEATRAHNSHKADQAGFLRSGGSTLFPEERALLGDVSGKRVLHLQCNSGQDSLSIAALGAEVTGVDISDEAIAFARKLSEASGIRATFERADIYDWLAGAGGGGQPYDIVFCSYGALCWLSDLATWAEGIARVLRPGGRFVTVEFHPLVWMYDIDWTRKWDYFWDGRPFEAEEGITDYVATSEGLLSPSGHLAGVEGFANPHRTFEFQWTIADVVTALIRAGLTIESLAEYPYANGWKGFEGMLVDDQRRTWAPAGTPNLPLMYSLSAVMSRPGGEEPPA